MRLAELLCARLCHDLSGLLGSLVGVLEIAHEEHKDDEAVAVAEQTASELAGRLKLLRAAWGPDAEPIDVAQLQRFAASLSVSRRLELDLTGLDPQAVFPPPAARVILNVLLLAADALPGGGLVSLAGTPAANILVTLSGPRAAWPPAFAGCLASTAAAEAALTSARGMQAPLTALVARSHGARLMLLLQTGPVDENTGPPPLLVTLARR